MDIPLPGGLTYMPDESAVIESETVRAARLMYSSLFEAGSLVLSIQEGLLGNGWRLTRTTAFPNVGTIQLYEKGSPRFRCGSGKVARSAARPTSS